MAPSVLAGQLGARAGFYVTAEVRVHPTGSITLFTGTHSHGQGHETTFAQVVADQLGVPIELVDIVHGDTGNIPFGMGTYALRSLAVGGSALVKAIDKVVERGQENCRPPSRGVGGGSLATDTDALTAHDIARAWRRTLKGSSGCRRY
jgi:carbon-monoxide dehydrogenase large subunit